MKLAELRKMREAGIFDKRDWEMVKKRRGEKRTLLVTIIKMRQEREKLKERLREEIKAEMTQMRETLKKLGGEIEERTTDGQKEYLIKMPEEELTIDQMKVPYDIMLHKLPKELQMRIPLRIRAHLNEELEFTGLSVTKPDGRELYLFHADSEKTCFGTMKTHEREKIESKEQLERIIKEYREMMQTIKVNAGYTVGNDLVGVKNITRTLYADKQKAERVNMTDIIKAREGNPYLIIKTIEEKNLLATLTTKEIMEKITRELTEEKLKEIEVTT